MKAPELRRRVMGSLRAASLAAALRRLLDQSERARLGTAALATYRRSFTPDAVAGTLLEGLANA